MRAVWDRVLDQAQQAHSRAHTGAPSEALAAFCPFPDDLTPRTPRAFHIPAARAFEAERYDTPFAQAIQAASPQAQWRETWKGSQIGGDFLDKFGCYCIIGEGGAFASQKMSAYMVYMPPGLYYPWHQHPAAELYLVLAGSAEFQRAGAAPETLRAGGHVVHRSGQPHATTTHDQSLLAYVLWKGDLGTKPIWTEEALR